MTLTQEQICKIKSLATKELVNGLIIKSEEFFGPDCTDLDGCVIYDAIFDAEIITDDIAHEDFCNLLHEATDILIDAIDPLLCEDTRRRPITA